MDGLITSNPDILNGKPCVEGTRLSVEFILELMASGATQEQVLAAYPQLTEDSLVAALTFAARSVGSEVLWERKVSA